MANTRTSLNRSDGNLDESLGVRQDDLRPQLSPVALHRDAGRRPLRNVGQVNVNMVIPDPQQPRVEFDDDALDRLAKSIREKGQLSPIRVRWAEAVGKWIIVSGERRWRATQRAGMPSIDCHFHEGELSTSEVLEQQLIENLLREDLQPIEEAKAFSVLIDLNGWSAKQLSEAIRVPQSKISRTLALLRLPAEIQNQVESGQIAARAGYQISRIADDGVRLQLAKKAAAGAITHDDAARLVRQRRGKPKPRPKATKQTFLSTDGWKVVVSAGRKGNYFEIEVALLAALDEVRLRIANNVQIF